MRNVLVVATRAVLSAAVTMIVPSPAPCENLRVGNQQRRRSIDYNVLVGRPGLHRFHQQVHSGGSQIFRGAIAGSARGHQAEARHGSRQYGGSKFRGSLQISEQPVHFRHREGIVLKRRADIGIDQESPAARYCQRGRQIQRDKTLSLAADSARNHKYLGVVVLRRPRSQLESEQLELVSSGA